MTDANKKTILIVEDEVNLSGILKDEFELEGFRVLQAKDGEEGLALITKERPDLILIDIFMPRMDGITMLKKIRQIPDIAQTPAVILTNLNDSKSVQEALENGAYDFLVKSSWEPKDLVKLIKDKVTTKL